MPLKPWEAARYFGETAKEIKAPVAITVEPKSEAFRISWQKRLGYIDGFIILLGARPDELRDHETITNGSGSAYSWDIGSLVNSQDYYTTVVAFRGNDRSEIPGVWRVTPNRPGMIRSPEKVDGEIAATVRTPETPAAREQEASPSVPVAAAEAPQQAPAPAAEPETPVPAVNVAAICGGCMGDVVLDADLHLYVCRSCGAQYVQRAVDGKFLPVSALTNGICTCCDPRRPLIRPPGEAYRRCSLSGEQYVELSGNGLVRVSQLDYGLCTCCNPPAALMLNAQGQLVCSNKRENLYIREGNRFIFRPPEAPPSLLDDIDQALANGSAGMMPNGILVSGEGNGSAPRPRRGRSR